MSSDAAIATTTGNREVSRCLAFALTSLVCLLLVACGGSGGSPGTTPTSMTYAVGVTVSGLVGSGLTLQLNGGDDLEIAGNGSINFSTAIVVHTPRRPDHLECDVGRRCWPRRIVVTARTAIHKILLSVCLI
jgi:hypothetical protein